MIEVVAKSPGEGWGKQKELDMQTISYHSVRKVIQTKFNGMEAR